jgi:hypothetical protein
MNISSGNWVYALCGRGGGSKLIVRFARPTPPSRVGRVGRGRASRVRPAKNGPLTADYYLILLLVRPDRFSHRHGDPVNVESGCGVLMGNCFIN